MNSIGRHESVHARNSRGPEFAAARRRNNVASARLTKIPLLPVRPLVRRGLIVSTDEIGLTQLIVGRE
jgi:hypothetical protein